VGEVLERGDLVASTTAGGGLSLARARRRLSAPLWRHRWLRTLAELLPPVAWMTLIYLAALAALFVYAFWSVDAFTGKVVHTWSLNNFREIFQSGPFRGVIWRTVWISAAVTATCAVLALPFAYFMARLASPRVRAMLFVLVLLPLWSSYLVRVYAWKVILANDGILNWSLEKIGLPGANIGYSNTAMWLVFTYIWLPFMILPVYAGLERIPSSLLEASADLGARSLRTFWRVTLPLAFPAVVAGSIFTFSLTLGDYILPTLIADQQFIGTVIYGDRSSNLPVAAAFAMVPIAVMTVYLVVARRLGAFKAL
jgi:putative spermidine/putrescine transport system permease protein